MNTSRPSKYGQLLQAGRQTPYGNTPPPENELDSLIHKLERSQGAEEAAAGHPKPDPLELLRVAVLEELLPVVGELNQKYASKGLSLRMDASNFLHGGRGIEMEFAYGDFRSCLRGTVTSEGIAFEEIRYAPSIDGELTSGPMLRARQLHATAFRDFACERLGQLLRVALRHT